SAVLTVKGRVGVVEDGRTHDSPAIRMMSGAWRPALRSSHLVALRATKAGPAARAGQRACGPGTYRDGDWCGPVTGCQQAT
ncbi:hypothetical protein, partial [Streptomyces coelicoflavus]|uniref:hypothetical protein n=1 Tax=Streptomyces coelicoflavus TaxID=285562 RepID=UPI00363138FD